MIPTHCKTPVAEPRFMWQFFSCVYASNWCVWPEIKNFGPQHNLKSMRQYETGDSHHLSLFGVECGICELQTIKSNNMSWKWNKYFNLFMYKNWVQFNNWINFGVYSRRNNIMAFGMTVHNGHSMSESSASNSSSCGQWMRLLKKSIAWQAKCSRISIHGRSSFSCLSWNLTKNTNPRPPVSVIPMKRNTERNSIEKLYLFVNCIQNLLTKNIG